MSSTPMRFVKTFAAACAFAALLPAAAHAQEKLTLSLEQCIKRAVSINPEVKGAEFETEVYRSKKEQADASRYPQIDMIAYGSLSPGAKLKPGLVESETNIHRQKYDGVFGKADIMLVQPLYTFGKITAYREAAAHGIKAYEAGSRLKSTEVAMLVKEAYYGLLLASETKGLLDDIKEELDKSTDKVRRQLDAGAPGVDQVDLLKLQTYQGEVNRYIALADEGISKARYGLRLLVGLDDPQEFEIADEFLAPAEINIEEFGAYRDRAMKDRLEFVQLREGLTAKRELIKAERADYYPQVFLAALYSLAGATNRDHLNNPYITDEYNHAYGGAVLGFKWGLDFGIRKGKVDEARAEYMKLMMKQLYAEGGVPYEVKDAYLQLVRSTEEMRTLSEAYRSAKQWVVASLANFDLGVGEARDIADSVSAYARLKADYFRSVYNQRMAIANLDHATGKDAAEVPYEPSRDLKGMTEQALCGQGKGERQ